MNASLPPARRTASRATTVSAIALLATALLATALLATACMTAIPGAPGASRTPAASVPPQATPLATASPQPSPTVPPTDPDGNHVGTGLVLTRAVGDGSRITELFVVGADGTLRQVTGLQEGFRGGARPVWSPDGAMIAFGPSELGTGSFPAVFVVNADGSGQRLVADLAEEEASAPQWSADGRRLLFADTTTPGERRLWIADLGSDEVVRIGSGALPRWLAGDTSIGFLHGVTGLVPGDPAALTSVVQVMGITDLVPRVVAHADGAAWSPDGASILLDIHGRIVLADADGSSRRELAVGSQAAWSPDGSRFAYLSGHDADGRSLVAVMDRAGTPLWSGVVGSAPAWSPDGSRLAVEVNYPQEIVRVLDAGTGSVLWETPGQHPAWRP